MFFSLTNWDRISYAGDPSIGCFQVIKDNYDIFSYKLANDFKFSVNSGIYPENMKYADVSPAFKNGDRLDKGNYRPVSILSSLSKIFVWLLYYQINDNMYPKLSIHQCGFRKSLRPQKMPW